MADQFCRIVDTTVCNGTLGSDATQSAFTTDANTSFVVRSICVSDSQTNANLCSNIVAVMDGHTVDGTKSFIVPPSSTVCIKDTSGNYPITYGCLELFGHMCPAFCGSCNPTISTCTVNSVQSGTSTVNNIEVQSCFCCNLNCNASDYDMHFFTTNRCALVHLRHDGNSVHCLRIYQYGCNVPKLVLSTAYYPIVVSGGMVAVAFCCCLEIYHTEACSKVSQTQYQCLKNMCNFLQTYAATSYSRVGLSGQEHPTCEGCRAAIVWKGGPSACPVTLFAFNICDTGTCIASQLLFCAGGTTILNSEDSNGATCWGALANSSMWLGAYYSKKCSSFIGVAHSCDCVSFAVPGEAVGSPIGYTKSLPSPFNSSSARHLVSQGSIWSGGKSNCEFISSDLDDILTNGASAAVTCYYNYGCCGYIYDAATVVAMKKSFDAADPADFDIDPTTKVSMYGIKST